MRYKKAADWVIATQAKYLSFGQRNTDAAHVFVLDNK